LKHADAEHVDLRLDIGERTTRPFPRRGSDRTVAPAASARRRSVSLAAVPKTTMFADGR
jgi:hypothetical protein